MNPHLKREEMGRLRSSVNLRAVLVLTFFIAGGTLLAYATSTTTATVTKSEIGTPAEQEAVRTSRDVRTLPTRPTCTVVPEKELFITHTSVVNDCWRTTWSGNCATPAVTPRRRGTWTLGGLLPGIFGTDDAAELSDLTLRWFQEWESLQTVVGDEVPARPEINDLIVEPWLAASGGDGTQLDMTKAPFRLLAIVARLDLRQNASHPDGPSAGEARFIFNVLDGGQPTQFNVIVEYELDADDCTDVLAWADLWHDLGAHSFGDSYNAALDGLTFRFTKIGASPAKKNGSAISQVRTNEIALDSPWELREFHLKPTAPEPAPLVQRPVALTPAFSRNRTAQLANFINANTAAILDNMFEVPVNFQQERLLGGVSPNPNNRNLGWDGPGTPCSSINDPDARHVLSLNTCSGCHGGETGTVFKHVEPRPANASSTLSGFLTGSSFTDRCGEIRRFGDIERRRVDLCQLLDKTCTQINAEPPISYVH